MTDHAIWSENVRCFTVNYNEFHMVIVAACFNRSVNGMIKECSGHEFINFVRSSRVYCMYTEYSNK